MKKFSKGIISGALSLLIASTVMVGPALAETPEGNADLFFGGSGDKANFQDSVGLGDKSPKEVANSVINVLMGFLGIIAVIIILIGGFKWMTAAGSEDKVGEAKKMIAAGVIGLAIILSAWGLTTFVIQQMLNATN